ncbi:MAG: hypothetical protein IJ198_03705 [Lachnospiraceae bacterium]|nr:hypothetical protein [Lachnospiraceae bacterium]
MRVTELAIPIRKSERVNPATAIAWSWRILNEYPEPLRDAVVAWASGDKDADFELYGYSLRRLAGRTGSTVFGAAELMNVLYKDKEEAAVLISKCIVR